MCGALQPSVNITIDTLHLVFSAFGTVHKIATFEKTSGFQALVQYPDSVTAEMVNLPSDPLKLLTSRVDT